MNRNKGKKTKGRSWKREMLEWGVMLSLLAFIYFMGWHTEISGRLQQALLWTGVIQPNIELSENERVPIDYNMPLVTLDGEPANLSDFKGDVVFLNFWATWCPPCIAEMPNIQALYHQYKNKDGIAFVMVSLDDDSSKALQFLEDRGFTFGGYQLNGSRPKDFQSSIIPTTYVISKDGILISRKKGMANYNTATFKNFLNRVIAK